MWIQVNKNGRDLFGKVSHLSTLGSSKASDLVIISKEIQSLHGQFIIKDELFFRDFVSGAEAIVSEQDSILVGEWGLKKVNFVEIEKSYLTAWKETFKSALKDEAMQLPQALQRVNEAWFLDKKLPHEVCRQLQNFYNELKLMGPVEALLQDPLITDILVSGPFEIWIERQGQMELSEYQFSSEDAFLVYVQNLLTTLHKTCDESSPYVDFILSDGSRGHLIAPPLTDGKIYLSIRKKRIQNTSLNLLHEMGSFDAEILKILKSLVHDKKNILIAGATGSGKTTLIRAFLKEIKNEERVVVLEDTPELYSTDPNRVFLVTRPAHFGQGEIVMRDLIRQSLRMRPDRLVVGEVRGCEALDLLHAMNTGHQGCFGSLHANSVRDALYRLQGLVQMADASLSEEVTRDLIGRNIHAIVFCGKDSTGKRKLQEVGFLRGVEGRQFLLEIKSC